MKIRVDVMMGGVNYSMEIEERNELETLHKAIVLSNLPRYCNECKNKEYFKLDTNKDTEANIYINVVCNQCFAKAKLGQYKSGGYFWHKFVKYVKPDA